jgi:hypothetical protein
VVSESKRERDLLITIHSFVFYLLSVSSPADVYAVFINLCKFEVINTKDAHPNMWYSPLQDHQFGRFR